VFPKLGIPACGSQNSCRVLVSKKDADSVELVENSKKK
jgi:hypothetical protein